jgi:arylsulfatase A
MATRRHFLQTLSMSAAALASQPYAFAQEKQSPNVIVIFTDDQGYADIGCFGAQGFETPHLDKMAKEGVRFTDFYVAQPVCGASRAALMTGCYPNRIGIQGAPGPRSKIGISDNEMTMAELFKQKNYATAIYGKWHLGDSPEFLPTRHGFDDYYGLPYSNDMWPYHPESPDNWIDLPLIEGEKVIATNPDQAQLTTEYTNRAVQFIEKNKEHPFFLYVAHSMPHVPLFVSDKFKGKSKQGLYGDVIMEIDWSVGQIMDAVKRNGLDTNTIIIFTSDNGPWLSYGDHAGSAAPLREGKGTTWDGGHRVPTIMRWPGKLPADYVCREPLMTIDLFPTFAHLIDAQLPAHPIDGKNVWPILTGSPTAQNPHDAYYFYWGNALEAVRCGEWKLHFPHNYRTMAGRPGGKAGKPTKYSQAKTDFALYRVSEDIGETTDVKDQHPDIFNKLKTLGETFNQDLQANKRPPGKRTS